MGTEKKHKLVSEKEAAVSFINDELNQMMNKTI